MTISPQTAAYRDKKKGKRGKIATIISFKKIKSVILLGFIRKTVN